ncbi:bifunctional helix-turn-helix transcriptional regulator/GNAT family N-acetyltransferase [Aliikangiella coralliicola]|uniref:GNAT family N-acetyltransferase n=1 Tax=Aliikangiella coralliicola TaxID=2592383 RepID=A0A545UF19_9GAMM|nr:bifunctional helix-turn-helix transcriptional regulator/GNAT family N-acetyltransferase [Aliikangiella coralliicola]TQV88058.1 GNAT family N-acetyltransferase [Aliikangiella coralliicola]
MQKIDFLDELGEVALGSRLKRLSERLLNDANKVYMHAGHETQPKWFTLLSLLHQRQKVTVVDAAELLGLTQPAISHFCKELVAKGLVLSLPCEDDSRRRVMSLTTQGVSLVEEIQPMCHSVELAAKQLCAEAGENFFESLKALEKAFERRSLFQRYVEIMENPDVNSEVEIVDFTPALAGYFKSINNEWIVDMFELESSDREILDNPQKVVIEPGGKIYFAKHPTLGIVGTCALLKQGPGRFELTKMGVLKSARGLKVGEVLLEHVIKQADQMSVNNLYLLTNRKCQAAIHLYEKLGFEHDVEIMENYGKKYQRCDVAMRYYKE